MSIALEKSCAAKIGSKTIASLPPPFKTCPLAFKIFSDACFIAGGKSIACCVKFKKPAKRCFLGCPFDFPDQWVHNGGSDGGFLP